MDAKQRYEDQGWNQHIVIREIQYIFQVPRCKFSHQAKKSQYQSIMQFLIPKQRNFFFCCC